MKLAKYIANLGYGNRREAVAMVSGGRVSRRDGTELSEGDVFQHDDLLLDGEPLDPPPGSIVMMHKPVGYECSSKGGERLIYHLLPERFMHRSPMMAPIGRLDLASTERTPRDQRRIVAELAADDAASLGHVNVDRRHDRRLTLGAGR